MGWEKISKETYICPCGRGIWEFVDTIDEEGNFETRYIMLCPICKEKYNVKEHYTQPPDWINILPYSDAKPSEVTEINWIDAWRRSGEYPKHTSKGGKWLIFADIKKIDELWSKIKKATEEGKLGRHSKVATAKPSPLAIDSETKVICVYTYDWTDEEDVRRVREELRKLGINKKIPYKVDEDTCKGKYQIKGHKKISKYFE
jgi:hypothetical protein